MRTVSQVLAIARTEFRFAFRRGAPVAVTVLIGLIVGAGIMVEPFANLSTWTIHPILTPEPGGNWTSLGFTVDQYAPFVRSAIGDTFVFSTMLAWLLIFLALLLLPMATAMSIPADRKFGVSELLRSTPITGSGYLAGKILGMLASIMLVGTLTIALFFVVTEIVLFSSFHFGLSFGVSLFLIKLALLDGAPILACGTAVGVLVGAFFRTRRGAILPGFLAGVASLIGWAVAFKAPAQGNALGMTDLVYYYLLQNYHSLAIDLLSRIYVNGLDMFGLTGKPPVGIGQIALMYLTVIAALAVLAGLARLWLQWKENF
jgi:ABC-type transport system involved in multi-copper enzyme maturation permease subunit